MNTRYPYYVRKTSRSSPPHTDETKLKISHANSRGNYETPYGYYTSCHAASAGCDGMLAAPTIIRFCRGSDAVITKASFARNKFLQTFGPWIIGKTYRQIGFGFTPKPRPAEPDS
jgi:hypothetical protein